MVLELIHINSFLNNILNMMKYINFLIVLLFFFESNGQIIRDNLSDSRDVTFFRFDNKGKSISLARILKKTSDVEMFSIRKGREVLVSYIDDDISFEFEEIGGYASLFFEGANFKVIDLNNDGLNELIIEIHPFESYKHIWIYTIKRNNKFEFIDVKKINNYKIMSDNSIKIETKIFCPEWGGCLYEPLIFDKKIDFSKMVKLDFFLLENDKLKNVNHLYQSEVNKIKSDYQVVLKQLEQSNLMKDLPWQPWHYERFESLKMQVKQLINCDW